jgi:putative ABC transport system permease protein
MLGLIATNLVRRMGRTLLTALGVGVGVGMIVALLTLTQGLRETAAGFIHLGNSDLGVFQSNVADPTASLLPDSFVPRIKQEKYVVDATPLLLMVESVKRDPAAIVFGAEPNGFFVHRLVFSSGGSALGPRQVMVGDRLARELRLSPGAALVVKGRSFKVAGVYHSGIYFEDAGAVLGLQDARALAGRPSEETTVAVNLAPGTRASVAAKAIPHDFPGTQVIATADEAARAGANNVLIDNAITLIVVLALVVGGIAVTNTMAMSLIERQGELALMSTVGWSSTRVAALIMGEGVGVSLLGAAIGLFLGVIGSQLLVDALGVGAFVSPSVTAWGLGRGLLVGVAIGVLGGAYPAWRVTRMRPLKGLARA